MNEQAVLGWASVQDLEHGDTHVWTLPSLRASVAAALPRLDVRCAPPPPGVPKLVVVGGGRLIDEAKFWRREHSPGTWLCAVPSLWGSGAEASPVAVRSVDGKKDAQLDPALLPEARAVLPGLASSIPADLARWGMGDAWSHVLEGFLSPLASDALRAECAAFMQASLLPAGMAPAPAWFDLSARACALQARSGVGLVHAIAHVLEPQLQGYGHARLCSIYLWPVFNYDLRAAKVVQLLDQYGLDAVRLESVFRQLFPADDYQALLPALRAHWPAVIRHPLARINSALVRADALAWFDEVRG